MLPGPPRWPGPPAGPAPARDGARGQVSELRRQGLSTYEISARLAARGTPLNRTGVGEILAEEGFGRLVRRPEPEASTSPATHGRDTTLPRASVIDFGAWPEQLDTIRAGLLLVLPDLAALDLPALAATAGYPGTRRAHLLRPGFRHPQPRLRQRRHLQGHQAREVIAFCDHWKTVSGKDPAMLVMDQKVTTQPVLGDLDGRGIKFLTLRMRSPALVKHISRLRPADYQTITLDRPGPHNKPRVHEDPAVKLTAYPGTVRQLVVTGLGRDQPTLII